MHFSRAHKPKQLELAHLSAEHRRSHLPFCTHPHVYLRPHPQACTPTMTQPLRVTTSSLMSHRPRHSCALPHEYKPTHRSRQIGPCQGHHFPAPELWTYSPTPPYCPHRSPGLLAQPGQGEGAESRPKSRWPSSCDWSGPANLLTHLDKAEFGGPGGRRLLLGNGATWKSCP